MNCTEGPVEIIEGYDIHTVKKGESKLYSVNDYCAHGDLYAFELWSTLTWLLLT